jgi:hypothetical protein
MGARQPRIPARFSGSGVPYRYMSQRAVEPHAQSLCFALQARQLQCSHQIHLRWFTSSTTSATIQRRISFRDTVATLSAAFRVDQ